MDNMNPGKDGAPLAAGRNEKQTRNYYADLSANAQRRRLLDALRCGQVSTLDARRNLDILHPAMRVRELRVAGYAIQTIRIHADTGFGVKHSVARYVLMAEPQGGDHGAYEPWLENLAMLAWRFESYGVTADLAAMDLAALWGLYCFLKRLAGE